MSRIRPKQSRGWGRGAMMKQTHDSYVPEVQKEPLRSTELSHMPICALFGAEGGTAPIEISPVNSLVQRNGIPGLSPGREPVALDEV